MAPDGAPRPRPRPRPPALRSASVAHAAVAEPRRYRGVPPRTAARWRPPLVAQCLGRGIAPRTGRDGARHRAKLGLAALARPCCRGRCRSLRRRLPDGNAELAAGASAAVADAAHDPAGPRRSPGASPAEALPCRQGARPCRASADGLAQAPSRGCRRAPRPCRRPVADQDKAPDSAAPPSACRASPCLSPMPRHGACRARLCCPAHGPAPGQGPALPSPSLPDGASPHCRPLMTRAAHGARDRPRSPSAVPVGLPPSAHQGTATGRLTWPAQALPCAAPVADRARADNGGNPRLSGCRRDGSHRACACRTPGKWRKTAKMTRFGARAGARPPAPAPARGRPTAPRGAWR